MCAEMEMNKMRKGVAIVNNRCHKTMVKLVYVSDKILFVKFKFEMVKVCVVVTFGLLERSDH